MESRKFIVITVCLVAAAFLATVLNPVSAEDWVFEPAPADRPKVDYSKLRVKFKRNKWGLIDPTPDVEPLKFLPKDRYGFVDWAKALREGIIAPKDSIYGGKVRKNRRTFNGDIIIKSKLAFMPDVRFPHRPHNRWLNCSPCHPKIFRMKAGATPMSMIAIWKGRLCGRCHDKVAFPIRNCFKCHSVKRGAAGKGSRKGG